MVQPIFDIFIIPLVSNLSTVIFRYFIDRLVALLLKRVPTPSKIIINNNTNIKCMKN